MNSKIENFVSAAIAATKVCHNNQAIIVASPTFTAALQETDDAISVIQAFGQVQQLTTKGVTEMKHLARNSTSEAGIIIAQGIVNFAFDQKKFDLLKEAGIPKTKFIRGRDVKVLATFKKVHELALANAAAIIPFGVTASQVSDYGKLIGDFEALMVEPRVLIAKRKNATTQVAQQVKTLGDTIKYKLDAGMEQFHLSNPDFYNEYFNARIIVDLKGPSTGIKGTAEDKLSHIRLKNAKITLLETGSDRSTSKQGNYAFKKLSPGIYTLKIVAPGYEELFLDNIQVIPGHLTDLDLQLVKLAA
ncbi:MAG: carboxypeptidase-like regulatory domain-containing protein [Bacteroidia bacterium]